MANRLAKLGGELWELVEVMGEVAGGGTFEAGGDVRVGAREGVGVVLVEGGTFGMRVVGEVSGVGGLRPNRGVGGSRD